MKNPIEEKITEEVSKDLDTYLENNQFETTREPSRYKNIWSPIVKILFALGLVCIIIYLLNTKMDNNKLKYFDYIEGTWIDENNNNYEIYDGQIEINQGKKDDPFYTGTITNILETDSGYKVIAKGYQISHQNKQVLDEKVEKVMYISFEIQDYTEEFEKPMKIKIGDNELGFIRVTNIKNINK